MMCDGMEIRIDVVVFVSTTTTFELWQTLGEIDASINVIVIAHQKQTHEKLNGRRADWHRILLGFELTKI